MDGHHMAGLLRRKKDKRRRVTYSVLIVGPSGTGKTSFANNLLNSHLFSHRMQEEPAENTNSSIKVIKPVEVVAHSHAPGIRSLLNPLDPSNVELGHLEPGLCVKAVTVEISTDDYSLDSRDQMYLNLIEIQGIGDNLSNEIYFKEIVDFLEQQFDHVLAEETRIKRNPRFEDGRVHVALYFIEPTGHGLRELDIEAMKKLAKYTNVLPIISRADSFTTEELSSFKQAIMRDIDYHSVPVYKFEVEDDEDDPDTIEEIANLAKLQPFSIICSDTKGPNGKYCREYPWGTIDIDDDSVSDLHVLKNVLFGSHLQEFKDTTSNILYENYRAEKLSAISGYSTRLPSYSEVEANEKYSAGTASSNVTSLVNTSNLKSKDSLTPPHSEIPAPETPSASDSESRDQTDASIRKISSTIKRDNEEIIRNIKSSPSTSTSVATVSDIAADGRSKLRTISETLPYVLRHERIIAKQQKLEELESQSARELQKKIQELEKKAMELKLKEKLLKQRKANGSALTLQSSNVTVGTTDTNDHKNLLDGGEFSGKEQHLTVTD